MRFQNLILAYFLIGAIMWGGGAIQWQDTGISTAFVTVDNGDVDGQEGTKESLEGMGGPIQEAAKNFGGALLAIWNFVVKFIGYLFWPVLVLESANAPPRITVTLGGTMAVGFTGAVIRLVRNTG